MLDPNNTTANKINASYLLCTVGVYSTYLCGEHDGVICLTHAAGEQALDEVRAVPAVLPTLFKHSGKFG
jgi:hypothetical protein